MYIQLTTRCNMTCGHCMFACTAKGANMTMRVFKAAVRQAEARGSYISLGGGEPTLHPKFWEMLGHTLGADTEFVWLATNGKKTETAIRLARMARKGVIGCRLSRTQFHYDIDQRVIDAFEKDRDRYDPNNRDARETTGYMDPERIIGKGRGANLSDSKGCGCAGDAFVRPDGQVYQCGCPDSIHIGNVFDGFESRGLDGDWVCWKEVA